MRTAAFSKALQNTERFLTELESTSAPSDVAALVVKACAKFGVKHSVAGVVPNEPRTGSLHQVLFQNYPTPWVERYLSKDYLRTDPVVHRAMASTTSFAWSEATQLMRGNTRALQVMHDAREFRLHDGFSTSMVTLDGARIIFSVAGHQVGVKDPELHQLLPLLAGVTAMRVMALSRGAGQAAPVTLTPREHEALRWVSEGKSDWEIGQLMSISEHGVDKHLRSVFAKLGTTSRAHAVAEALRRRLLT